MVIMLRTHIYQKTSINTITYRKQLTWVTETTGVYHAVISLLFHPNNHLLYYCYDPLCLCLLF